MLNDADMAAVAAAVARYRSALAQLEDVGNAGLATLLARRQGSGRRR
jgi:hypothetical protein